MNDQRKTKKQLLEELVQERELVTRERERSIALQEVSNKVAAAHDTDEVLGLIVNEAARLLGATGAYIRLLEGSDLVASAATKSLIGYVADSAKAQPTIAIGATGSGVAQVMATKNPVVRDDAAVDEDLRPETRLIVKKHGFHGTALVPLVANDRSIGVLSVMDKRIRRFTDDEVSLLVAFADQAALALDKARLLSEAEREKERSDAFYQVSSKLAGAHDTGEILDLIVNEAARLVGAPVAILRLLKGDVLVPGAATASARAFFGDSGALQPTISIDAGRNFMTQAFASKEPLLTEDIQVAEEMSPAGRLNAQKHGIHGAVAVPLLADDRAIGVLAVGDGRIRRFTDDEVSLLTALADQAVVALEKARLLSEAEREKERSDALYQVANKLAGVHETDEVLDLIVNEAARLVGTSGAWIRLLEGEVSVIRANTDSATDYLAATRPAVTIQEGQSNAGHVMATKVPLVIDDAAEDDFFGAESRRLLKEHGIHGRATVPMVANDRSIGVLVVVDKKIRRFTGDEVSLLMAFADQAALALEKARLLNEAERQKDRSDALYRISNLLAGVNDTEDVLDLIVNEAARLVGASGAWIRLLEGEKLVIRANTESVAGYLAVGNPAVALEEGTSPAGQVMATKKPLVMEDATEDDISARLKDHGFHGRAGVPLLANDRSIGVLFVVDKRIRRFTEDEISLLMAFANQAALALEKARLLNEAERERGRSDTLYLVANRLAGAHDTDEVLVL